MKRIVLAAAACLACLATTAYTQEMKLDTTHRKLNVDTSLATAIHKMNSTRSPKSLLPEPVKPAVTMTSLVIVSDENIGKSIDVLKNNTLRLDRFINVSNGQAWNWSPFPNGHLDARTLSFPMPR